MIKNFCKTKIKKIFYLLKNKKKFKGIKFSQSIKFGEKDFHPIFIEVANKKFENFKLNKKKSKLKLLNVFRKY